MFYPFNFLQSDTGNPFSWIVNAISSEKSYRFSKPFLLTYIDVRALKFFPHNESWLVNYNIVTAHMKYKKANDLIENLLLYEFREC